MTFPTTEESLRRAALEALGALAPALAHEVLSAATLLVDPDVLAWEGSLGTIHAHRVRLVVDADLRARALSAPAVIDALTAAVAAVLARFPGAALAELAVLAHAPGSAPAGSTAYRGSGP